MSGSQTPSPLPPRDLQVVHRTVAREQLTAHLAGLGHQAAGERHVDRGAEDPGDDRIELRRCARRLGERGSSFLVQRTAAGALLVEREHRAPVREAGGVSGDGGGVDPGGEELALRRRHEERVRSGGDHHEQRAYREGRERHGMVEQAAGRLPPERVPVRARWRAAIRLRRHVPAAHTRSISG